MTGPGLTVRCRSCNHTLILGPANTVLTWVKHHEYMSYLEVECPRPQCGHSWSTFLEADNPEQARRALKRIRAANWPLRIKDPTPPNVISDYEEAADIHLVHQLEAEDIEPTVRQRQDRIVATLAWELETATVQDILDTDIDTHTPRTWT